MKISQPDHGYRFTSDAVALAGFVSIHDSETLLDLCSGPAVIPLLLWQRSSFLHAVAVELNETLAALGQRNVVDNGLEKRIHVLQADVRVLTPQFLRHELPALKEGTFDIITSNPPYWQIGQGRLNPDPQKALARHEISLTLVELLTTCKRLLNPAGRLYLCHLLSRQDEINQELTQLGFRVTRAETLAGRNPRLLLEAQPILHS